MDIDDQMQRYFSTRDLSAISPPALAAGWSTCKWTWAWRKIGRAGSPFGH